MLTELISDDVSRVEASNQPMFRTDIDYDMELKKRNDIVAEWKRLTADERSKFRSQEEFEKNRGTINLKAEDVIPAKNFSLVSREAKERIASANDFRLLPLDGLDFDDSVLEIAESIENTADIRDLYRLRKKTVAKKPDSGINTGDALRLKNCFTQGRELYLAGKNGSLMVKPLNFFYALTAYSYGIIVLNNPLRYSKRNLPGSHGMAYLPDVIQAQFGGDSPRGTFSDLVTSFPTHIVKTVGHETHIDCVDSLLRFYETKFNVSLGVLISMIPEMADYYKLTTGRNSRCHPLEITNANTPRR